MRETNPLLWNGPKVQPRKASAGMRTWTLRRADETMHCELRYHGDHGVEFQIFVNGELRTAAMRMSDVQAEQSAEEIRQWAVTSGWSAQRQADA